MTKEKATNFLSKVLARLTGGDEAKISRFQAKVCKTYTTQINIRKAEIEDLKEKINDQEEKFEDTLVSVDVDQIKTTEGVESYIPKYTASLTKVKKAIKELQKEIETKEAEIAEFEALLDVLK